MLFDAIEFAARAHAGQYRKGSRVPYILHPLSVAKTVLLLGGAEHLAIAAVLHDTVEDTPVTLPEIRERFGPQVARLVESMTEPDKRRSWEERKQHTLDRLAAADPELLLLAAADKLDNIRSIREDLARVGEEIWGRFRRSRDAQRWYYESLVEVFRPRMTTGPLAQLLALLEHEVNAVFDPGGRSG